MWRRRSAILLKNLPSLVVWNVMGSKNFLILQAVDVATHSADLHQTWCFMGESWVHADPNWSSAGFAAAGMQLNGWFIRKINLLPLFHCHPFYCGPWQMRFFVLLSNAGLWALIRPLRPLPERIGQTVLVDTGGSGDQFSCGSTAVKKGPALDCQANKRSSPTDVFRGLPDLGLSAVSLKLFLILSTWGLDTLKIFDLVFSLLKITLVCGWIFGTL